MLTRSKAVTCRAAAGTVAIAAIGGIAMFALFPGTAQAVSAGGSCKITTYYKDAGMTQKVGSWSNCPGQSGLKGRKTKYFETDTVDLGNEGPKPSGDDKKPPCEFLQEGCSNLPESRY